MAETCCRPAPARLCVHTDSHRCARAENPPETAHRYDYCLYRVLAPDAPGALPPFLHVHHILAPMSDIYCYCNNMLRLCDGLSVDSDRVHYAKDDTTCHGVQVTVRRWAVASHTTFDSIPDSFQAVCYLMFSYRSERRAHGLVLLCVLVVWVAGPGCPLLSPRSPCHVCTMHTPYAQGYFYTMVCHCKRCEYPHRLTHPLEMSSSWCSERPPGTPQEWPVTSTPDSCVSRADEHSATEIDNRRLKLIEI